MPIERWHFEDPTDTNTATRTYYHPINPNEMSSPFPERAITSENTTAIDGRHIMWEGHTPPVRWTFGGAILSDAHYEALRSWVYDRQGRLLVWDHFGRVLTVSFLRFDPEPKRSVGRYWRHNYTITAWVYSVAAPTVGLGS